MKSDSGKDLLKKALKRLKADPALFCEKMLHVKPFPYQEPFLNDPSKRIVMCAGRRVGKSIMTGARALWFCLVNDKVTVLIVSATLRQSIMMFDTILDYISDNELIENAVVRQTRTLVRFNNGSKIKALPCGKGKGLRGDTCHLVVMDEAAFMPEEVISEVLLPMLATTDGSAIMLSTPWAKCYTMDTDVMTENGWKNITAITKQDKVACLIGNEVEYHNPEEVILQDSDRTIEFESSKISLRVTPEHRMYVRKRNEREFSFRPARELLGPRVDLRFKTNFPAKDGVEQEFFDLPACDWFHVAGRIRGSKGETVNKARNALRLKMDDWLEFLGYWLAEGTLFVRQETGTYHISISQSDKDDALLNRMIESIKRLGFRPHLYHFGPRGRSKGENRIMIYNKQLAVYLGKLYHKSIPVEIKKLSSRQLRILYDAIYAGDGDQRPLVTNRGGQIFCGIYDEYANDVQEISLKLGFSSSKRKIGNMWLISNRRDTIHKFRSYAHPPKEILEKQRTYCLTVPGGLLFVRRRGLCCWSGNSHIFYKAFTSSNWSKYHYPTSVNPLVKPQFLSEQRELVGERRYQQEYEAQFVDDAKSYFPSALLRSCLHVCEGLKCAYCELFAVDGFSKLVASQHGDSLYGGYDPGGKGDPAAFVVVEKLKDGVLRVVLVKTYLAELHGKKVEDPNLYTRFTAEISEIHKKIKLRRLWVDQTGLGQPIIEQCKALNLPAEGLNLSSKTKEEVLANLKILFENKKIILPSGDRDLELKILANLNCIEAEAKPAGGWVFSHPSGTHDDIAFALALACWGATRGGGIVIMMKDEPSDKTPSWRQGIPG